MSKFNQKRQCDTKSTSVLKVHTEQKKEKIDKK